MSARIVPLVKGAVLSAAFLLTAPQLLAGGAAVRAADQAAPRSQPVAAPALRPLWLAATAVSVSVTAATPAAKEEAYVTLRGPDGQMRRFAVEGGREALPSRVVVLRPGDSVTIQLTARK
jgi:hypothetical protein